jgi:SH3-like domain-containing protein
MTLIHRTFVAVLLSAGFAAPVFAADPPVIPADPAPAAKKPAAKKPAKTAAAKKPADKPAAAKSSPGVVVLPTPETAVVSQKNVNVRGQALLNSEIVARLKKGDKVTVIEEITTKKKKDEPEKWYKVSLPSTASVWVNSSFLDADKKVKPNKLNIRSGPGENYSVIGRLEKGAQVNSFAFVAAHLVTREPAPATVIAAAPPPATVAAPPPVTAINPPPAIAPPPVTVVTPSPVITPTPVVAPPPVNLPPVNPNPPVITTPPPTANPPVLVPVVTPNPVIPAEEPLAKRVVTREGIVKGSVSVQAPTHFVLRGLDNNRTINFLLSTSTNISLKELKGQRVIVTGEEVLDERWPSTPVIEIETVEPVKQP